VPTGQIRTPQQAPARIETLGRRHSGGTAGRFRVRQPVVGEAIQQIARSKETQY